ncbi:MAG: beta-ketoacyl-ACP synthase II [Rickettsiales bacterium]
MRRVVVTGIGSINPLGITATESWNNLIQNKSGIKKIPDFLFDTTDYPTKIAGIVPAFNLDEHISPKEQRKMDKFIHFGVIAADEAIKDSGIADLSDEQKLHAGVMMGSGIGGLSNIYENSIILKERGPRRISPFFIPSCLINLISGHISIKFGLKGPNHAVVTACSTGAHAIGDAARIITDGDANVMVAGGAEAAVTAIGIAGFNACRALSTAFNDNPEQASRPWDKARDGFVMGEGAGALVLEELEHAKKRGAKIYAEVIGYGLSGDAFHITAPQDSGDGAFRAMQMAAKRAKISASEIDYINAHGTSTPLGDVIELSAVKRFMGDASSKVSMSSTKSSIGHLLGAAGAVEAVFSILALQNNIAPPTLNLESPEDGCDMDLVPLKAKERNIEVVLSNSFGFGGTNASLLFKKFA